MTGCREPLAAAGGIVTSGRDDRRRALVATTALVTGSTERVERVVAALQAGGVEAVGVTDLERLDEAVRGWAAGSLDCYIQLPVTAQPAGATVIARVRGFLESGLLTRFRLAETVLPAVVDGGLVLLVAGHTPVDRSAPDDQAARMAFLDVLAHAIRADKAPAKVRVRVLDHGRTAAELARLAVTGEPAPRRAAELRDLAAREAEMSYQDWRTEVLGLASVEF
jgi:hypothetical protein